jgi:lipopolysaccharide export system protein LptA
MPRHFVTKTRVLLAMLSCCLLLGAADRAVKISGEEPLLILADVFEILKRQDGSEVGEWRGNVKLRHADYHLQADRLQAFRKKMDGVATGNVTVSNPQEGITLTSERLYYRDDFEYIEMTGNPYLVRVDSAGVTTTARSERMEFYQQEERGRLLGAVEIRQGELVALCEEAVLYNLEDKIVLSGEPTIRQQDTQLSGEKMVFYIEENRLQMSGDVYGELYPETEDAVE